MLLFSSSSKSDSYVGVCAYAIVMRIRNRPDLGMSIFRFPSRRRGLGSVVILEFPISYNL